MLLVDNDMLRRNYFGLLFFYDLFELLPAVRASFFGLSFYLKYFYSFWKNDCAKFQGFHSPYIIAMLPLKLWVPPLSLWLKFWWQKWWLALKDLLNFCRSGWNWKSCLWGELFRYLWRSGFVWILQAYLKATNFFHLNSTCD